MRNRWQTALCSGSIVLVAACGGGLAGTSRTPIIVPPEAVREWAYTPEGSAAPGRYVVRMTDGHREWEFEFPDSVQGSEVRVPLKGGARMKYGEAGGQTAADRELDQSDQASRRRDFESQDPMYSIVDEDKPPARAAKPAAPTASEKVEKNDKKSSYLVGVAQIRDLYNKRNYEIALVQLVDLEKDYPGDEKLLAMKGSIYRKMGKVKLAREAWERVLALDPDNTTVAAALRELADEEEGVDRKAKERAPATAPHDDE